MYFIEKIIKLFSKNNQKPNNYVQMDIDTCEHLFVPLDSSKEYLACSKCGKVIKNPKL